MDHIVFSIVSLIGTRTGIPIGRARRELSIDLAFSSPILKTSKDMFPFYRHLKINIGAP